MQRSENVSEYDRKAKVQARVVARMGTLLEEESLTPKKILDVGTGTGNLLAVLQELYPNATAVGADVAAGMCRFGWEKLGREVPFVNVDTERLPFADGVFDLVVSTSTFQWLSTLDKAFTEIRRVLKPGGVFSFALFGERTLFELRETFRKVLPGVPIRTHTFFSERATLAALSRLGFWGMKVKSELEVERYEDVPELLSSLVGIDPGTAAAKALAERPEMRAVIEAHRHDYGKGGGITATYEVVYGFGRAGC